MNKPKLVLIDPKQRVYSCYEGRQRVEYLRSDFSLTADEIEALRVNPASLLGDEEVPEQDQSQVS